MKKVLVLGSTGSIGSNTLEVIAQNSDKYQVVTLTANTNVKKLAEQAIRFNVENVVIADKSKYPELKELLVSHNINIYAGIEEINNISKLEYDITVVGISGIIALNPIMNAIQNSKVLAIANKESIICAGEFILKEAKKFNTKIIPLDSEHNAIFQIFEHHNKQSIDKIYLTASGGPLLNVELDKLKDITPEIAIAHPNWKMGKKISVDSANMMNKGLEVIEACILFDLDIKIVDAIIHPQSFIHAMIHYNDGSVTAQMGYHDMKTPISLAFDYPQRTKFQYQKLDLIKASQLTFKNIDEKRFPLFYLAKRCFQEGQAAVIILNIANEVAVHYFLNNKIGFLDIEKIINTSLDTISLEKFNSIDQVVKYSEELEKIIDEKAKMFFKM
ncbi:MAG: 1-deoxy-D-xylulose-5-phosphate reductoisomerase [Candidatus Midichloriaceae bacterium]|jgi:1-deoxy-D-xylulose-5-phosphate reductoisomerase